MFRPILMSALIALGGSTAIASELDNEGSVTNQGLQGTVVIRVDSRDGSVAMAQAQAVPADSREAKALSQVASFRKVGTGNLRSELDQDAGASSWYWHYNPYSYSHLGWYGYNYRPYYTYSYSYYSYYYYSSYAWGRYWY